MYGIKDKKGKILKEFSSRREAENWKQSLESKLLPAISWRVVKIKK